MKQVLKYFIIIISFNMVLLGQTPTKKNGAIPQEFYYQLSLYGQWIEDANYGYVWIPKVEQDFIPYLSNGYWELTNYGWMWMSEYEWGWAPFHYGRWDYNGSYSWFWVPDNEWGPSWVTWRKSEGYYGWAPMSPGISINITFEEYNEAFNDHWIFIKNIDIQSRDIGKSRISQSENIEILKKSTVINNSYYNNKRYSAYITGPGRDDVQQITGRTIKSIIVHEKDKPGQSVSDNQLQIYMPQIQKNISGYKQLQLGLTKSNDIKRKSEGGAEKKTRYIQLLYGKTEKEHMTIIKHKNKSIAKGNAYKHRYIDAPQNDDNDQSSLWWITGFSNDDKTKNP